MKSRAMIAVRIMVVFVLVAMLTVCVFPHADVPYIEQNMQTRDSENCIVKAEKVAITSADLPRSVMCRETLGNRGFIRNDNQRTGTRLFSFLLVLITAAQLYFMAVLFVILFIKSDVTPRFSIILFLHRSDGKKSALVLA